MAAEDHLSGEQFQIGPGQNHGLKAAVAVHAGEPVAGITWHIPGSSDSRKIDAVWTHPDHRRQGLASRLKSHVEEKEGYRLRHSSIRTEAGDAWARSQGSKAKKILVVKDQGDEDEYAPRFREHLKRMVSE